MTKILDGLFTTVIGVFTASLVAGPAQASVVSVPEPTTLGLLAAGFAAAAIGARLRKRK